MTEQAKVCAGATVGAAVGAALVYLFFTERGQVVRDRIEPAVDDMVREFNKFKGTMEKIGDMANDGVRAFHEFQQARGQFPDTGISH